MKLKFEKVRALLQARGIKFIDRGKNVKKGNINIKCPLCKKDTSEHMGIDLTTGHWGCWRDSQHRGKNIYYLLGNLLGLDRDTVRSLLPRQTGFMSKDVVQHTAKHIKLLSSFIDPLKTSYNISKFNNYLRWRGFEDIESFVSLYKVKYALSGEWANRIIFPLYQYEQLVSYHTRSISAKEHLPYRDTSIKDSVIHPKKFLWNYNRLQKGGDFLYITEGIFDALKLDFYTDEHVAATCLFTKTIRQEQVFLLYELEHLYAEFRLCLDADALCASLAVRDSLMSFLGDKLRICFLPEGRKDPGEMTEKEIQAWF